MSRVISLCSLLRFTKLARKRNRTELHRAFHDFQTIVPFCCPRWPLILSPCSAAFVSALLIRCSGSVVARGKIHVENCYARIDLIASLFIAVISLVTVGNTVLPNSIEIGQYCTHAGIRVCVGCVFCCFVNFYYNRTIFYQKITRLIVLLKPPYFFSEIRPRWSLKKNNETTTSVQVTLCSGKL